MQITVKQHNIAMYGENEMQRHTAWQQAIHNEHKHKLLSIKAMLKEKINFNVKKYEFIWLL